MFDNVPKSSRTLFSFSPYTAHPPSLLPKPRPKTTNVKYSGHPSYPYTQSIALSSLPEDPSLQTMKKTVISLF